MAHENMFNNNRMKIFMVSGTCVRSSCAELCGMMEHKDTRDEKSVRGAVQIDGIVLIHKHIWLHSANPAPRAGGTRVRRSLRNSARRPGAPSPQGVVLCLYT